MIEERNLRVVQVSDKLATASTRADLVSGDAVLVDESGTVLTDTTAGALGVHDRVKIVSKQGDRYIETPYFKKTDVTAYKVKSYTAPTQQITYIGYNGSNTETLESNSYAAGNEFTVVLRPLTNVNDDVRNSIYLPYTSTWYSGTDTTGEALANGLIGVMSPYYAKDKNAFVKPEVLCSEAGTASSVESGADTTHWKFTYGSTVVLGTNSSGVAVTGTDETSTTMIAGNYLRVGTAKTAPVYKIKSYTAGTGSDSAGTGIVLELETPYLGDDSVTALAGAEYITAAEATGADYWGIKLTGVAKEFKPFAFNFDVFKFQTWLKGDWTDTVLNDASTVSNIGCGSYEEVAQSEAEHTVSEEIGQPILRVPKQYPTLIATSGKTYDLMTISFHDKIEHMVQSPHEKYTNVMLWIEISSGTNPHKGQAKGVPYALDDFLDGYYSAQNGNLTS